MRVWETGVGERMGVQGGDKSRGSGECLLPSRSLARAAGPVLAPGTLNAVVGSPARRSGVVPARAVCPHACSRHWITVDDDDMPHAMTDVPTCTIRRWLYGCRASSDSARRQPCVTTHSDRAAFCILLP